MCGVVFDRTQARVTEEELRRSEARYRALIEASNQVVWSWNLATQTGHFFDTPHWWEKITRQSPRAQAGVGWLDVVHPDDREHIQTIWTHALETGTGYNDEYRICSQDGSDTHIAER